MTIIRPKPTRAYSPQTEKPPSRSRLHRLLSDRQPGWLRSSAVHRHFERRTYRSHALVAQSADPFDQHTEGHALDRVEIDCGAMPDWIIARFEDDLACQSANRGRTWGDQGASEALDCDVSRENDDWTSSDLGWLAPPQFASRREGCHVAAAPARNDARSPHSSGSSRGWAV